LLFAVLCGGAVACRSSLGVGSKAKAPTTTVAAGTASGTAEIDALLKSEWTKLGLVPAKRVDDSRFLRRVYLDVVGRIPTVDELAAFVADGSPDRRAKVVAALLASPRYADHWAAYWDDVLIGDKVDKKFVDRDQFDRWLYEQFRNNTPWNKIAIELITAKGINRDLPSGSFTNDDAKPSDPSMVSDTMAAPSALPGPLLSSASLSSSDTSESLAQQNKPNGAVNWLLKYRDSPQDLAGKVSSVFLGVKIQCAQCHDHKTEKWKQQDFQRFAACFARTKAVPIEWEKDGGPRRVQLFDVAKPAFRGPNKSELEAIALASPTALDGTDFSKAYNRREALAQWMQSPENPWFAKAIVNRMWGYFLGRGFVEPVDDFRASNPALVPDVLDKLAIDFIAHGYDLRYLFSTITSTEAYQLSAERAPGPPDQPTLWSSYPLKPLGPDELLDSIAVATDLDALLAGKNAGEFGTAKAQLRKQFNFLFDVDEESHPAAYEGTIPQALMLMNGRPLSRATNTVRQGALVKVLAMPVDDAGKIEALFLRTVARKPTPEELQTMLPLVQVRGPQRLEGYEDIFWALLNSSEFIFNH
jgi:hypothetical protein